MMSDTMASMGAYVVLAFIAGQFVAYFNWTHLGAVTAVKGAGILQSIGLQGGLLMVAFLFVASMMNFLVGSASAKWAFMAPIFVPMLMQMGLSPEATQAAYRVGDSITNIISPLMPYLPIIIVFAQKYDRKAGMGTIWPPCCHTQSPSVSRGSSCCSCVFADLPWTGWPPTRWAANQTDWAHFRIPASCATS